MSNYKKFDFKKLYFILYILLVLFFVFFLFKLGLFLSPFVIAIFLSILAQPISNFLMRKLKFSNKWATISSVLIIILFLFGIVGIALLKLIGEVYNLSQNLEFYSNKVRYLWHDGIENINVYLGYFPKDFNNEIMNTLNNIVSNGSYQISLLINKFVGIVTSLPTVILYIAITVLSTFFMSIDKEKIGIFLEQQFPHSWLEKLYSIKNEMFTVIGSYLKAQAILVTLCFIELLISFNILSLLNFNIQYPLLMSIIVCIIDALPILGAGTVLIPWAVFSISLGDFKLAIALIIIYIIVLTVRQMLEPKLISQNIGVHPLITLISMYSGFKILGIIGFLVGPIVMIILKNVFSKELEIGFFREIFSSNSKKNR